MIEDNDFEQLSKIVVGSGLVILPVTLVIFVVGWIKKLNGGLSLFTAESTAAVGLILANSAGLFLFAYKVIFDWQWLGEEKARWQWLSAFLRIAPRICLFLLVILFLVAVTKASLG